MNDKDARFCDNCGRRLDDVKEADAATVPPQRNDQKDREGRLLANDGLPVGDDLDGAPGGERIIWEGRPSALWSPRMALTNRYKLTNQRLIMEFGFIGRRTEEIDLFRVNDVGVKQHPLERIVGIGDIYIASADTSSPQKFLHNIKDSVRVKDLLREVARQERHRRRVLVREDV
ncbi:MAG: PH domain-containing protein [Chloroflexia bacterium]|nr:PH domain-containing protein [Chloroflexia bacterium]